MKCSIIKDLLNLYIDDLCSEENDKLIKKHLESCEECKKTYNELLKEKHKDKELLKKEAVTDNNKIKQNQIDNNDSNNKLKPFKKIRFKLVIRYLLNIILSLIIIFMLFLIGTYTWCVINQEEGTKDLTTYLAGRKAKKVTEQLLVGNIDEYVDSVDLDWINERYISNYDKMIDNIKTELNKEYKKNLKDKVFKVTVNNSFYTSSTYKDHTQKYIQVFVDIEYDNKAVITFSYHFYNNYNYYIENVHFEDEEYESKDKCIAFKKTGDLLESLVELKNTHLLQYNIIRQNFIVNTIDEDYQTREGILELMIVSHDKTNKNMYNKLKALFEKGVKIDSCSINNLSYNTDKKQIDGELVLIMSDGKNNKWTLIQSIYFKPFSGYYSIQMVCKDQDAEIIGIVPKSLKEKKLKKLFR